MKIKILISAFIFLIISSPAYATHFPGHIPIDIGNEYGFGDIKSLGEGVSRLVAPTFSLATALVIIYFLIGAFKFLTSSGDKESLASARGMIIHAIIGFVILMFAFLILQFIPQFFGFKVNII